MEPTSAINGNPQRFYTLRLLTTTHDPADATTYYFGGHLVASTTAAVARLFLNHRGRIVGANIGTGVFGVLGTAGNNTFSIRLNDTTDFAVGVLAATAVSQNLNNVALDVSFVPGAFIEIKILTPTWATNPTSVLYWVDLLIEEGGR